MIINSIKEKLGDCKYKHASKCDVKNPYLSLTDSEFYVFDTKDDQQPVRIVQKENDYQLTVKNLDNEEIWLIKTDNCLIDKTRQKCDCILIGKDSIYFVEIKSSGKRNERRKDAVGQLETTLKLFHENKIDRKDYDTIAFICFASSKSYPTSASRNSKRDYFLKPMILICWKDTR